MRKLDDLEKILIEHKSKRFFVIETGGNNGDRLIYRGMYKKLNELGINYFCLRYKERPRPPLWQLYFLIPWRRIAKIACLLNMNLEEGLMRIEKRIYEITIKVNKVQGNASGVFLIHGGGNINDLWGNGLRLLKNVIRHNPDSIVIVAPQSYYFKYTSFPALFKKSRQEIYLFCREKYSYKLLNSMSLPENVHILLSHDTTFYLSKEDFHARIGDYDLICLRTDSESKIFQNTRPRITVSDLKYSNGRIIVGDISLINQFEYFVNLIENSRKVITDRLHVAILAAILGKETVLLPNSYYKNRGVYEFSLKEYPNVRFIFNQKYLEALRCAIDALNEELLSYKLNIL
jgi:exopolysaccharide biosynthesis predicted pyruvyltransferase EpsI